MSSVRNLQGRRLPLRLKIVLAMGVVALVTASAILATSFHFRRKQLLDDFQVFVRGVAGTTALALDGDEIEKIQNANDPAFQEAREVLDQARVINGLAYQEIYILRPVKGGGEFEMEFVVMLQRKTFVGSRYTIPERTRSNLRAAWMDGSPSATGIYEDPHGRWISGYAPLISKQTGEPVAIIEADAEVSRFLATQRRELLLGLGIAFGGFCVAMVPGLLLSASITRGLNQLSAGMTRFRSGEHDVQVRIGTGDEIEELGSVFNEMILSLGEKLALLPYVSRFTAEAVKRSRDDPSWLMGSEQEVTVLFADLRGFTLFSENREATVLVRELNQLLAVQADVVVSAGGDVDKFIGDAVMAVFIAEENSPAMVFECAQRLLQRVHEETAGAGWSLGLGVGIHSGRAVVGSIGSETRRDFTAIGHTVNMASRLCDRASAWEVLVTETFYESLPAQTQTAFQRTEAMQFKNVQQLVTTYRWRDPKAEDIGGLRSGAAQTSTGEEGPSPSKA